MQICYLKWWITFKIYDRIKQTINEAEASGMLLLFYIICSYK